MKITRLTTYLAPPRWLFLKIETDEGIAGWGEPVLEGAAQNRIWRHPDGSFAEW